ncbi:MAG TPA: hypothetical protein VGK97_11985, partial [Spongiibacteraceae bacterium]
MSSQQFNVIADGTVLEGFDAGTVLAQLQQQLKLPEAKAQQLIAGKIVTVKRNVDAAVATTYCKRLLMLGVSARAVPTPIAAETQNTASLFSPSQINSNPQPETLSFFSAQQLNSANSPTYTRAVIGTTASCISTLIGYTAIALLGAALFLFFLVHFAYLLTAPPIIFSATVYLLPLSTLLILAVVLLRPFLPIEKKRDFSVELAPLQQPALFTFVTQLCEVLALKAPQQITLTSHTNNSFLLLPGFKNLFRGEYRLTLSLPLLENSTRNQFTSILAADLATQATLPVLRFGFLSTSIGARFSACIAGRDWIMRRVGNALSSASPKLRPLLMIANALSEQANRQLQKFAARIELCNAQLLRATLIEHDRYYAMIAGSATFANMLILRSQLDNAAHDANAKNLEDRIEGGLVDDLPILIRHYYENIDPNFARELQRRWDAETTPRRDEPPIARERIERVTANIQRGILSKEDAAQSLLRQRDEVAKLTTCSDYRTAGLTFNADQLLPVDELTYAATQDILQRQQGAVYFNNWLKPFRFWKLADFQLIRDMPLQDAAMQLSVCVNEIRRLTPDRARLLIDYERLQNQVCEILLAQHVLAAGKIFPFRYVSYDGTTLVPVLEDRQRQLNAIMEKLSQQETVMGGRITLGLRLSGQAERDVQQLHDALRLLHDIGARLYKLSLDIFQLEQLLQRQHELREADYNQPIKKLETKIYDACVLLIARLNDIPYPPDPRQRSLKIFIESALAQTTSIQQSPILSRARRLRDLLYRVNEKLSLQAADYGTIAEEAYRIEPIKLVGT